MAVKVILRFISSFLEYFYFSQRKWRHKTFVRRVYYQNQCWNRFNCVSCWVAASQLNNKSWPFVRASHKNMYSSLLKLSKESILCENEMKLAKGRFMHRWILYFCQYWWNDWEEIKNRSGSTFPLNSIFHLNPSIWTKLFSELYFPLHEVLESATFLTSQKKIDHFRIRIKCYTT